MKIRLTVKRNLMIVMEFEDNSLNFKKGSIFSYSTNVATLKENKIFVNGKYSRTTTKHISHIAWLTKSPIQMLSKSNKMDWWYEYGAKVTYPESFSPGTSEQILKSMDNTFSFIKACSQVSPSTRKDSKMLEEILLDNNALESIKLYKKLVDCFIL